jgi:hypothetical protein
LTPSLPRPIWEEVGFNSSQGVTMALHIKDPETDRLARRLAELGSTWGQTWGHRRPGDLGSGLKV